MEDSGWLVRGVSVDGSVRVLGVRVADAAERIRRAHGLSPGAARLAAEGLVATALLAAFVKGKERLTLQVQSRAPACAFMGDIDGEGHVRGRFSPQYMPVGTVELDGALLAIKTDGAHEVYRGVTEVRQVTLADALAEHMRQSAQVEAELRVMVSQTVDGAIRDAGGVYLERLPGPTPEVPPAPLSATFEGVDGDELLDQLALGLFGDWGLRAMEQRPLVWRCTCSVQRVHAMLFTLGADELADMLAKDGQGEVTCEFCATRYVVSADDLRALEARARVNEA